MKIFIIVNFHYVIKKQLLIITFNIIINIIIIIYIYIYIYILELNFLKKNIFFLSNFHSNFKNPTFLNLL